MLQNLFKGTFNLDPKNLYVRYYGYEDEKLPAAHSPNFQQCAFAVIGNLCWNMVANVICRTYSKGCTIFATAKSHSINWHRSLFAK